MKYYYILLVFDSQQTLPGSGSAFLFLCSVACLVSMDINRCHVRGITPGALPRIILPKHTG